MEFVSNPGSKLKLPLIITIVVVLLVAVLVVVFLSQGGPSPVVEPPSGGAIETPDLGSNIYEKASNPVSGQLPETVAPVANPLENAYQNPFE